MPPTWFFVHATNASFVSCTFLVLFLLSYLSSCLHGHPHVPWWIPLVPASSINWREATPTHQDGSHFESRNFGLACCRDPSHSLSHTHAILADFLPPLFPFPDDELCLSSRKPRITICISAIKLNVSPSLAHPFLHPKP